MIAQTPPRKRHAPLSKVADTDADSSLILDDDSEGDKGKGKGVVKRYDNKFLPYISADESYTKPPQ